MAKTPKVGMGCSLTDRCGTEAYTVIEIVSTKNIRIQQDKGVDGDREAFERDPLGTIRTIALRPDGQWTATGMKNGEVATLKLGRRAFNHLGNRSGSFRAWRHD